MSAVSGHSLIAFAAQMSNSPASPSLHDIQALHLSLSPQVCGMDLSRVRSSQAFLSGGESGCSYPIADWMCVLGA
jgi:hypothetical protein